MAVIASGMLSPLLRAAREELLPFEGRFGMAWRVAAQCMIAAAVFMTYGIPMAAIGCYLILFIMKPDSMETSLMAVAITLLVCVVVVVMFVLLQWTIDSPLMQMAVLVGASVLFLYIGAASQLGPVGNIIALVIAFIMTLIGDVPFGEVATRGLLYAWLMAVTPMGLVILFNLFFGRSSLALLRRSLEKRLRAAARVIDGTATPFTLEPLLQRGNEALNKQAALSRLLHLASAWQMRMLTQAISGTYRLLLAVASLPPGESNPSRRQLAEQCEAAAQAIGYGHPLVPVNAHSEEPDGLGDVRSALAQLSQEAAAQHEHSAEKKGFFSDDARSNPVYLHFALRTTAAAVICYLVYTAIGWQDIHTAMVTCYVAALGSTAETVHKLFLRIVGCLIGAAMGIAAILFVIPHITSIGALMVLVFLGILVAGWVTAGSERISYAGVQIGLAFLLTVLQGYGPDVKLAVAGDRIAGILLGNFVMFVLFTKLWPVGMVSSLAPRLRQTLQRLIAIAAPDRRDDPSIEEISDVIAELHNAREALQLVLFEPRKLHPADSDVVLLREVISRATHICRLAALKATRQSPEYDRAVSELPGLLRTVERSVP